MPETTCGPEKVSRKPKELSNRVTVLKSFLALALLGLYFAKWMLCLDVCQKTNAEFSLPYGEVRGFQKYIGSFPLC